MRNTSRDLTSEPFKKNVAIVSGASAGLGREISLELMRSNYFVVGNARNPLPLEELKKEYPDTFDFISGDISQIEIQKKLLHRALEFGDLKLLVNNAAISHFGSLDSLSLSKAEEMVKINALAPLLFTIQSLPELKKNNGSILQIASVASFFSLPYNAVYSASKHFIFDFSKGLEEELKGSGVSIFIAFPHRIKTEFAKKSLTSRNQCHSTAHAGDDPKMIAKKICSYLNSNSAYKEIYPTFSSFFYITLYRIFPLFMQRLASSYAKRRAVKLCPKSNSN